jgi:hypothetical protein
VTVLMMAVVMAEVAIVAISRFGIGMSAPCG